MKKTFFFSLGLVVAFASLFVSCGDKNNDANVGGTGSGDDVLICKISVSNTNGGSVEITNYIGSSANVIIGNGVEVVATPETGYNFLGWFIGDSNEPVSTDAIFTFTASKDIALLAKFEKSFSVSVCSAGNGKVSFKDIEETSLNNVLIGTELTVEAVASEKCEFVGWFIGDSNESVSTDATYTFTVAENVTLVAKFNKWPLVSISSGGNGSASFENSSELSQYVQPGEEVTIVATPAENSDFVGWFIGESNELVSIDVAYTFAVSENVTLIAQFVNYNGHEYVDLGLPSGLKWATCNVGANSPEEYGGYYAWGETEEKENYSWETYKWCNGNYNTMTKYCKSSDYGTVDNKTVLDSEDDVAHVKWGGSWRMPTEAEQEELYNNCSWSLTTQNGVNGYRVTGPNGNSIFLPVAGYRIGTVYRERDSCGLYWLSSLASSFTSYYLCLDVYNYYSYAMQRCYGLSVRPVSK